MVSLDLQVFGVALLTGLGYGILGLLQAFSQKEAFDGVSFLKTVLLSLVSAGVITTTTSSIFVSIAGSGIIVVALDKVINTARNLYNSGTIAGTTAPQSPTPAPSTPPKSS